MRDLLHNLKSWLEATFGLSTGVQTKLLASAIIVLLLWGIGRVIRSIVRRQTDDVRTRYTWSKATTYVLAATGIFLISRVWFEGFGSIATFLGLVSAGLAIALKDLLVNLAGWAFILWRRPFSVGDRIEVSGFKGDVIDVRLFQFTLLEIGNWVDAEQSTGRMVHVPNGKVLIDPLANYTKSFEFIWNELPVLVTFESNWRKAKDVLQNVLDTHGNQLGASAEGQIRRTSSQFLIFYSNLTPIVYTKVVDSGVLLTMRYLTDPRKRRATEAAIWEAVLDRFAECPDIDFAYPTTRFYDNRAEGKPAAGGPSNP